MTFGDRMREYRDHRGWSLGDLARATHYSRGHLSNVENGRKTPTEELVQRMQASDTTSRTLEMLHATVEELCCQYNRRDALELRREAHGWLQHVVDLLHRPTGLKAHQELLVAGGWLALLAGCVEYDLGLRSAAEATRIAAVQLGLDGLREGRQSRVHLLMVARELDQELRSRYAGEGMVRDFGEALRAV